MPRISFQNGCYEPIARVLVGGYATPADPHGRDADVLCIASREGGPTRMRRNGLWVATADARLEVVECGIREDLIVVTPEDKRRMHAMVTTLYGHLMQGRTVAIACSDGNERSAAMAALLVRRVLGLSGERAIEQIRSKRPEALRNRLLCEIVCEARPVGGVDTGTATSEEKAA